MKGKPPEHTRFKKGQSGNPKGRPKKIPALDVLLADVLGEEKEGTPAAKVILLALRQKATKGDVRAAEILLDRAYGKAKDRVDLTSGDKQLSVLTDQQFDKLVGLLNGKK